EPIGVGNGLPLRAAGRDFAEDASPLGCADGAVFGAGFGFGSLAAVACGRASDFSGRARGFGVGAASATGLAEPCGFGVDRAAAFASARGSGRGAGAAAAGTAVVTGFSSWFAGDGAALATRLVSF